MKTKFVVSFALIVSVFSASAMAQIHRLPRKVDIYHCVEQKGATYGTSEGLNIAVSRAPGRLQARVLKVVKNGLVFRSDTIAVKQARTVRSDVFYTKTEKNTLNLVIEYSQADRNRGYYPGYISGTVSGQDDETETDSKLIVGFKTNPTPVYCVRLMSPQ